MIYSLLLIVSLSFFSAARAQTVFIDDLRPSPDYLPSPDLNFEMGRLPRPAHAQKGQSLLPAQLSASLGAVSAEGPQKCEDNDSYLYALSLTLKGNYTQCAAYVDNCLKKYKNIPVSTVIQGARCAKAQYDFTGAYNIFAMGLKSSTFRGENSDALILEFALFAQYSIYPDKTDAIINSHPTWTQDERDTVKSLVEFLGKTTPKKKSKDEIFQYVDAKIQSSHEFLARLLRIYRVTLNLNEYRFQNAYDRLLQDASTLINPLDWWQPGFQTLYAIAENADFAQPLAFYKAFVPYAHSRSYLPLEQNVYNYTQIDDRICKDTMLQGAERASLQEQLNQWKAGNLSLTDLIAKIEARGVQTSTKSDLLSTYAGLLVIDGQKDKAREYYWKAHLACNFNNRSHWGLVLLERKMRYAAYPEFNANIQQLKDTVAKISFPQEIAEYFVNWKSLPEASRERIKYGARIWAQFMKDLSNADYKVYIKSPFELLSQAPGFASIRDARIGPPDMPTYKLDNRLWDDVRGAGGQYVIADHDETFETVQGDYNLLGHEVTHQFHAYINSVKPALGDCVEKMYANAKKTNSFPDPYAGTNSREYFAQGITYFLIPADAPARFGLNSSWHPKNDPDLYKFMVSIQNSGGDLNRIQCPF